MNKFEIHFGVLRLPVDLAFGFLALISAYFLRKTDLFILLLSEVDVSFLDLSQSYARFSLILTVALIVIFSLFGLYSLRTTDSLASQVRKIFFGTVVWLMLIITYYFLQRDFPFSRSVILMSAVLVVLFVSFGRVLVNMLQKFFLKRGMGVRKVLLVGNNVDLMGRMFQALKDDTRFRVVGYLADVGIPADLIPSRFKMGNSGDVDKVFKNRKFDDVMHIGDGVDKEKLLDLSRLSHREYQFVPEVFELQRRNILLSNVEGLPVFRLKPTPLDGWGRVVKRTFDIVVSLLLLILLMPFFLIVALVIRLTSKGPVFFRFDDDGNLVERAGYRGEPFCCWKFRTMKVGTHTQRYNELSENNIRKGSPLVKITDDPRVTVFGKFLRRFDIDELPQLWNVLKGDMSLVGPRPHLLEEVERYKGHHRFVFTVKPGMTGLAQVSGRSDLDFEEEVRLDSFYIENWTILMDLKILLKTALVVLKGHGEVNK